jgi:hypothetical protein
MISQLQGCIGTLDSWIVVPVLWRSSIRFRVLSWPRHPRAHAVGRQRGCARNVLIDSPAPSRPNTRDFAGGLVKSIFRDP